MSEWNPNSSQHKAKHCGYKKRPTKSNIKALLDLYSACQLTDNGTITKTEINKQLKIPLS